jgi:hypothetical protein
MIKDLDYKVVIGIKNRRWDLKKIKEGIRRETELK